MITTTTTKEKKDSPVKLNFAVNDFKVVKSDKQCSLKHLLELVNGVLDDREKIKPTFSRYYRTELRDGTKVIGSLTCLLYLKLAEILGYDTKNLITLQD